LERKRLAPAAWDRGRWYALVNETIRTGPGNPHGIRPKHGARSEVYRPNAAAQSVKRRRSPLGLIVQSLFSVTLVALSAAAMLCVLDAVYLGSTGMYFGAC
jgi:hypothetical protein